MKTDNQCLNGKIFLVAEDDPDIREILVSSLEMFGAFVISAENGSIAAELYKTNEKIDCILSDIRMPDGDGIMFLETISLMKENLPPFFFLTGFSDLTKEQALLKGARDMFYKPFDIQEVILEILKILNHLPAKSL